MGQDLAHHYVQFPSCFRHVSGGQVGVPLGHARRLVAEKLPYGVEVYPLLHHARRRSMPQGMKRSIHDAQFGEDEACCDGQRRRTHPGEDKIGSSAR